MFAHGLPVDVVIYNTLLNGLCKNGQMEKARELLDEVKSSGIKLNSRTYNSLIEGY